MTSREDTTIKALDDQDADVTQLRLIIDNTLDDHLRGEFTGDEYMTEAGRSNRLRRDSSSRWAL